MIKYLIRDNHHYPFGSSLTLIKVLFLLFFPLFAHSQPNQHIYQTFTINSKGFRAIQVTPKKLNLHWKDTTGIPYRQLSTLKSSLLTLGKTVTVMMNAGIYSANDQPAGLHIEKGKTLRMLNLKSGYGNFHLQPNGVFYITQKEKPVIRTTKSFYKKYGRSPKGLRLATQSGPMLLINGRINAQFLPDSSSEYSRNGVCIKKDNEVYFLATDMFVRSNLYTFAKATQYLGCENALYLDGNISKLYMANKDTIFHFSHFVGILTEKQ
ncbi:MAG: phosphodiester glycosidase family protein [Ostreibacterium sp.]